MLGEELVARRDVRWLEVWDEEADQWRQLSGSPQVVSELGAATAECSRPSRVMEIERVTDPDDSCRDDAHDDGARPCIDVSSLMRRWKTCSFTVPYCTFVRCSRRGLPGCGAAPGGGSVRAFSRAVTPLSAMPGSMGLIALRWSAATVITLGFLGAAADARPATCQGANAGHPSRR